MKIESIAMRRRIVTATVLWGVTVVTAQAQFIFGPAIDYGNLTRPSGITGGDFNGDLHLDLATTSDAIDRVVAFRNTSDGTFPMSLDTILPASSSPQDVIAGDWDNDLDTDLAVAVRDPQGSVQLLINSGSGVFTLGASIPVGDRPRGLSVADMDGDDDLDIAVANRDSGSMSVLTNSSGTFTAATTATGEETRDTTFGNFLGDAALEIAATDHDNRSITILSQTSGAFSPVLTLSVGPALRPDGITTADLNNDGLADIGVATDNFATVFLNNGAGFNAPVSYSTGGVGSADIVSADFDCDGTVDLAISNTDSNNVSLLRNQGSGIFTAPQLLSVGVGPDELTAADLDSDGDFDLAVVNSDSVNLSVLLNETCMSAVGDFNGDGNLNCADVDALVVDIVAGSHTASFDLTGDGVVDQSDLTQWLSVAGAANLESGNPYLPGDANLDGVVDVPDFNIWNENKFTSAPAWCSGDFNADGVVDVSDFNVWNDNKFTSAAGNTATCRNPPDYCCWCCPHSLSEAVAADDQRNGWQNGPQESAALRA